MTDKYFFKVLMSYAAKNRMDEEINKYFKALDASLINSRSDLTNFRKSVRAKVKEIHTAYPRCKNIPLDIYSLSGIDETLNCGSTHAVIYRIDNEFKRVEKSENFLV